MVYVEYVKLGNEGRKTLKGNENLQAETLILQKVWKLLVATLLGNLIWNEPKMKVKPYLGFICVFRSILKLSIQIDFFSFYESFVTT